MFLSEFPGVFCPMHIIYLIVTLLLTIIGTLIIIYKVKSEKTKTYIITISAILLFIAISVNRISVTYMQVKNDGDSWIRLLPNTFCGLASLLLSVTVLVSKKDNLKNNVVLHFVCYYGFFGAIASDIYPDYLESQTFTDIRSLTGLLHHSLMLWLICCLLATKRIKPDIKKFICYPAGYAIVMILGVFEKYVLKFNHAMNIGSPLISSLPILTSWYIIGIVSTLGVFLIEFLYFYFSKRRTLDIK